MSIEKQLYLLKINERNYSKLDSIIPDKVLNWISEIFDLTEWRCLFFENYLAREYHGYSSLVFIKAYTLPYLIDIPSSERKLGFLIINNKSIQKICGLISSPSLITNQEQIKVRKLIGKRSLWHFRKRYQKIFPELILKSLILLALSGSEINFDLPFIEKIDKEEFLSSNYYWEWQLDEFRYPITITFPEKIFPQDSPSEAKAHLDFKTKWSRQFSKCKSFSEYCELYVKYNEDLSKSFKKSNLGYISELHFPINIKIRTINDHYYYFKLIKPIFHQATNFTYTKKILLDKNSYLNIKTEYDKACNILVAKRINGEIFILLSQRISFDNKPGPFAAPGGKQKLGEKLQECAIRELEEETGIKIIKSKPVSIYYTSKNNKQTMSVGVFTDEWVGTPQTLEPQKHVEWQWYNINELPNPLFEHTQKAIEQYKEDKYPNLSWSDFEEPIKQPSLFNSGDI
jgi:8-oxo-dGTP diphosphatase